MAVGHSICATQTKVFITGASNTNKNTCMIFDGRSMSFANTLYQHCYHSSVVFRGEAYIISGMQAKGVENYSETSQSFTVVPGLKKPRMWAICVATDNAIFVAGGATIREGKGHDSKSVWKYESNKWEKQDFKLPDAVFSPLYIPLKMGKVLIMGGKTDNGRSKKVYSFKLESGAHSDK